MSMRVVFWAWPSSIKHGTDFNKLHILLHILGYSTRLLFKLIQTLQVTYCACTVKMAATNSSVCSQRCYGLFTVEHKRKNAALSVEAGTEKVILNIIFCSVLKQEQRLAVTASINWKEAILRVTLVTVILGLLSKSYKSMELHKAIVANSETSYSPISVQ